MIILKGEKKYKLPNSYSEINYKKALRIKGIDVPKGVKDIWENGKGRLTKEVAKYYNECLSILVGEKFDLFIDSIYEVLKASNLDEILLSINNNVATLPIKNKIIIVKGFRVFRIIKDRTVPEDTQPLFYMSAIEFIECLNAAQQELEGAVSLSSILYRNRKYTEKRIIKKIKLFEDLDLNVMYYAMSRFNEFLEYIEKDFSAIFIKIKTDAINEFAYKKSGMGEIGYYTWIVEVAKSVNMSYKNAENMNVYSFLEKLNIIKAENNYSLLLKNAK